MKKFCAILVLSSLFVGCAVTVDQPSNNSQQVSPQPFAGGGEIMANRVNTAQKSGVPAVNKDELLSVTLKTCTDQSGLAADKCFEAYFLEKSKKDGPEAAFAELKVLYERSADAKAYCHPLSHVIGHGAVVRYPDVNQAYEHGDDFCWSGYYHGVMEEIMEKIGMNNLSEKLDTICAKMPGKASYSFQYYNCVHGMGHGLMDVMGDKLIPSLKMCDNLTGSWEQQSCYSGIFMQNIINDGLEFHKADLKPSDTVYPCTVVDQKYKEVCYLMQTSYMLKINNYNFKETFDICFKVDKGFEITCYRSLGRDASGSTVSDIAQTRTNCLFGSDYTQQSECFVGAVKDFVSYYHSDVKAKQLCATLNDSKQSAQAIEGEKMADYCTQTVVDYYKSF